MRFPRQRRITSRQLFQRVRTQGSSCGGHYLVLGWLRDPELAPTVKVGYITTRKLGNAVVRNQVRRRLRGILQRTGDRLKKGFVLVLIARNAAAAAPSLALEKEWKWLARRAGILESGSGVTGAPGAAGREEPPILDRSGDAEPRDPAS